MRLSGSYGAGRSPAALLIDRDHLTIDYDLIRERLGSLSDAVEPLRNAVSTTRIMADHALALHRFETLSIELHLISPFSLMSNPIKRKSPGNRAKGLLLYTGLRCLGH
jgi:hypothetical protein